MFQKTVDFFMEARQELRKVTWPGRKEITTSTGVVVLVVIFFVGVVVCVDWVIRWGMSFFYSI